MKKENGKSNILFSIIAGLVFGGYTLACTYLFYMQAARAEGQYFESDLPAHLKMAADGTGYSLTAVIYRLFMRLPLYEVWVAIFLSIAAGGTMIATYFAIRKFVFGRWSALGTAVAANIVMPAFVKAVHYERYIGYQSPSIWHNSTYTVMKFFALLSLVFYLRYAHSEKRKTDWKSWILFVVFLTLSTATKTSFLLVLAPVAFVGLIIDLIRKVPLRRVLLLAASVIPSVAIVLYQELILFGEETGNGVVIEFGYNVYLRAERPYLTMILSALFPVLIFLFNIVPVCKQTISDFRKKHFPRHTPFILAWSMWSVGAVELLFLKETGDRILDGNFAWGYDFCLFALFVVSIIYFMNNLRSSTFLKGTFTVRLLYAAVMGAVLGYHMYCGFYFFIRLLEGVTYFMQG
ncbi:MAG: hypothetical protein IKI20_08445 [Lachnospiraceae bacterium]|nr:hypothetical protein [Lachnospiraceae bacterium]